MANTAACTGTRTLTSAQRLALYRTIYAARRIDDREIAGKRQNKVFFQINGAGHEAIQAAAALCLRPGHDWFFLYYRDRALAYGLGVSARDMFLASVGADADPATGGRQMPSHWSDRARHIFTTSSPTGSQCLQAVGAAEALLRAGRTGLDGQLGTAADGVALASLGDGAAAEGEFWESVNAPPWCWRRRWCSWSRTTATPSPPPPRCSTRAATWRPCSRAGRPTACWSWTRSTAWTRWPATRPWPGPWTTPAPARARPWSGPG